MNRFEYGNPLNVLLRRESRTCKGCKWKHTESVFGKLVTVCTFVMANGKRRDFKNRRCKSYAEL